MCLKNNYPEINYSLRGPKDAGGRASKDATHDGHWQQPAFPSNNSAQFFSFFRHCAPQSVVWLSSPSFQGPQVEAVLMFELVTEIINLQRLLWTANI